MRLLKHQRSLKKLSQTHFRSIENARDGKLQLFLDEEWSGAPQSKSREFFRCLSKLSQSDVVFWIFYKSAIIGTKLFSYDTWLCRISSLMRPDGSYQEELSADSWPFRSLNFYSSDCCGAPSSFLKKYYYHTFDFSSVGLTSIILFLVLLLIRDGTSLIESYPSVLKVIKISSISLAIGWKGVGVWKRQP